MNNSAEALESHCRLLVDSYQSLLGKPLLNVNPQLSIREQLDAAEFVLLSHGKDSDPLFNYGNQQALQLFELRWDELLQMPSRLSAEAINQQQRAWLLAEVSAKGFIENYNGVRISKTGKRFEIHNAVVWNLYDQQHSFYGQAACFNQWTFLS